MKNTHFFFFSSQKSPRKSVKDYVSNVDDFVAPFENFLEESIMEEDFMLANDVEFSDDENDDAEELKQDFIDEGKVERVLVSCYVSILLSRSGKCKANFPPILS